MPTNPPDLAALVAEGKALLASVDERYKEWLGEHHIKLLTAAAQLAEVQERVRVLEGLLRDVVVLALVFVAAELPAYPVADDDATWEDAAGQRVATALASIRLYVRGLS